MSSWLSEFLVMSVLIFSVLFTFLKFCAGLHEVKIESPSNESYYKLPRFWTNTGFCPLGEINNGAISGALLSEDVTTNLHLIGALPNKGVSSVRVHWLLELVEFIGFNRHGIPSYNFEKLDNFLSAVNEAGLAVGFEFMGSPNDVLSFKNISRSFIWEDLTFQIVQRYLELYGIDKILEWKFESWNEPDLKTYNKLNFTIPDYFNYLDSLRRGLDAASRTAQDVHFQLRGPAGLFKSRKSHPLCWSILEKCNNSNCPFDILTFHRKGNGGADEVVSNARILLSEIFRQYPKIAAMEISNDEADPISGWSTSRPFQSDVRYAVILASIVFKHWSAMLQLREFKFLESISHDNAFLSYHPHEFDQRTLLARFQMNLTNPPHTQFIQKPVYDVLGLLGNLGELAKDIDFHPKGNISLLRTASHSDAPLYLAYVLMKEDGERTDLLINVDLSKFHTKLEHFAYVIEAIEEGMTDPVKVWNFYGKPSYPNATVRKEMRMAQTPSILGTKIIKGGIRQVQIPLSLRSPWVILLRVCSSDITRPFPPYDLRLKRITSGEVLILWKETFRRERCLKTYEVFFSKHSKDMWKLVSGGWHIPFLSFHFHPQDEIISGSYKVRGIDIFGRWSDFSEIRAL